MISRDIKRIDRIQEIKLELIKSGLTPFILYCDCKNYEEYKAGIMDFTQTDAHFEMCVLDILERLGFPMDELGTVIFKNMVVKVAKSLDPLPCKQNIVYDDLRNQINEPYSQFYLDVARNDLGIGTTTCHLYITEAMGKIDLAKADKVLFAAVFGGSPTSISYGDAAYLLGAYIVGRLEKQMADEEAMAVNIGQLKKGPNFALKYGYKC